MSKEYVQRKWRSIKINSFFLTFFVAFLIERDMEDKMSKLINVFRKKSDPSDPKTNRRNGDFGVKLLQQSSLNDRRPCILIVPILLVYSE
jgi:hypothetical protein